MARALRKGMLGGAQGSLAPSLTALGPNRYLREKDFFTMMGVAFGAHLVVLLIASILPHEKVTDIPVRALTFKIGGQDRIAAFGTPTGVGVTTPSSVPVTLPSSAPSTSTSWRATPAPLRATPVKPKPKIIPIPVKPAKITPIEQPRMMPEENTRPLPTLEPVTLPPPQPVISVQPTPTTPTALPDTQILTQVASPAIAGNPQRFIREVGAAPTGNTGLGAADGAMGGKGTETGMSEATAETIRERYEQQISTWIQQHKLYPASANGQEGKTVVRMRIDRSGYVRYYAVEQSSGNAALDLAAIDMIRRANPVPSVPPNYPAGSLIEFLIPITFRVPR